MSELRALFSHRLQAVMRDCGVDEFHVAKGTVIQPVQLKQWIEGRGLPSIPSLVKLQEYLGCPWADLLGPDGWSR